MAKEVEAKMSEANAEGGRSSSLDTLRDHLANERTLLAWSRTGIAVVGLGFVVARFALGGKSVTALSTAFGVALVVCGGGLLAVALRGYLRVGEAITRRDVRWSPTRGIALAGVLELCAIIVCVYLIVAT
jgi:putative membrane protein